MNNTMLPLIDAFTERAVLVIGDAMLDAYLAGSTNRLAPEAPVPIVDIAEERLVPGGAANTAANLALLGAKTSLLAVTGDDDEARILHNHLRRLRVDVAPAFAVPGRRTIVKRRVLAESHMLLRLDEGSTGDLDAETEATVIRRLKALWPRVGSVIVSDYGYGVLTPSVVAAIGEMQAAQPRVLVVDSKHLTAYRHAGVTAVKPNYDMAMRLLGIETAADSRSRVERVADSGEHILTMTGAQIAAVTLDTEGALVFERGCPPYRTYAQSAPRSNTAGAGDTFIAALALALASGADTPSAAEIASAASAVVVAEEGTTLCATDDLRDAFAGRAKCLPAGDRLASRVAAYRAAGKRVVFTNGCFDILHRGHVTYLSRAKTLGDVLVIGLNSDASVRRLKGAGRPINALEDRMSVLAALSCVDCIVPFDEETPERLIEIVRPDVFVKGGDYTRERLPEARLVESLGGKVEILPFVEERSTTRIIERIRAARNAEEPTTSMSGV